MRILAVFAVLLGQLVLAPTVVSQDDAPVIAGEWEGPGYITVEDASRIFVQCRVKIAHKGDKIFRFDAACATKEARIAQSGTIVQVRPTLYHGTVINKEFGVSGQVTVRTEDVRQVVLIKAEKGSGRIVLSRRTTTAP